MRRLAVAGLFGVGVAAACALAEMPGPDEGAALFAENCAMCHGPDARGTGELAEEIRVELGRKPADLTRLAQANKGVFPRAEVLSYIDGYTRGRLPDQNMPEFGLLLEGPSVPVDSGDGVMSPAPRPLVALMVYLESIQR
ncbi:c-type cytochrome [Alisedimentitalea sp. MJ-SS2]|uniref:c-type cytochrome n=1 Tax=Aliisedimentitalea sp. MJ-SS2 TaxID=3049795 RepID=UPI002910F85F|nr:c-type cytochrome [Alisedimentitalea sp. MJ-SS2]MDU8928879.1 c-type cytochrome [Alisedimentitalea sp. MJ-SS2]